MIKNYNKKTNDKIIRLMESKYRNTCIFIFPEDLRTKSMQEIFKNILTAQVEQKEEIS